MQSSNLAVRGRNLAILAGGLLLLIVAGRSAPPCSAASEPRGKYPALLESQGPGPVARLILAAYEKPEAAAEIERLGNTLAASSEHASAVLEALAREPSVEAASVGAELLFAIASRVGGERLTDDPGWRHVSKKGIAWLEHDDPFVRGIAAWAMIAVRDANLKHRPGAKMPGVLAPILAIAPEASLECDFVFQAFRQGIHRTPNDLRESADDILRRAEQLARSGLSYGSHGNEVRRERAAAAVEWLRGVFRETFDGNVQSDLAGLRKGWMRVRRAARKVVLAGSDLDFREIVFFKVPARTEGNHPDCLVQNHDRPKERAPGGDIFVQTGLGPLDPARPLISGRLGPGHVQDMDLWWNADRLVFAYVRQPRWGEAESSWGKVAWRNGRRTKAFEHVVGYRDGVFWENGSEPTHLHEIRLDGTGLRSLTNDPLYCDREPAYLPNGDVVFSSDRGCGASQCGAAPLAYSDFGLPNLFRVSADGKTVSRLTHNKDVDRYPHCLSNGLVGYMRWDYQERYWQWPHAIWVIHPDGTMNDGLFKVHFKDPQSVREPRSIPGSRKLVVLACGHHSPAEGAVALVDPSLGANNPNGLQYVTPGVSPLEGGFGASPTVVGGGVPDRGGFYRNPWPLSENGFLAAYAHAGAVHSHFAVYYIDVWGNKELIRREPGMDLLCPMPVRKRPAPPRAPSRIDEESSFAVCFLDNVHRDLPGVEAGTVRYLRISERLQWYFRKNDNSGPIRWTPGTQHSRNFGYWTWSPTRVIGTVPVEDDGSACFRVPAGLAVSFQALDENRMEIRRMRSHIEFKPGEFRGCIGCHETKHYVPSTSSTAGKLALKREPSVPEPPPWGDVSILDYEKMIQPIFERHCVRCHGRNAPEGGLDLTGARDPHGFVQSYRSLFGIEKGMRTPLGEGFREAYAAIPLLEQEEHRLYEAVKRRIYRPGGLLCLSNHMSGPEVTQPKQFGSHQSRLVLTLLDEKIHREEVLLTSDEWETLVTWVDANAPYHATFYQYFDPSGKLLPNPLRVRVELDPPFQQGEKTFRIVARSRAAGEVAVPKPANFSQVFRPHSHE